LINRLSFHSFSFLFKKKETKLGVDGSNRKANLAKVETNLEGILSQTVIQLTASLKMLSLLLFPISLLKHSIWFVVILNVDSFA